MAKRKEPSPQEVDGKRKVEDEDSNDDVTDLLNVDFEWFDPQEIDFHGLKTLLRQLFDVDNQLFDLSELTNLILSQPTLGSTVKVHDDEVETNQTDPYAFLTVINLHEHRSKSAIQHLITYILTNASNSNEPGLRQLNDLLSTASQAQVGLILSERFINMPSEVTPPMYKMLIEEISWAIEDKEPYKFSHYLFLSKTYTEIASKLGEEDDRPQKKKKSSTDEPRTFYFHPEDEILHKHALGFASFGYNKKGDEGSADAKRAFQEMGIKPQGHMILIEAGKFEGAVKALEKAFAP